MGSLRLARNFELGKTVTTGKLKVYTLSLICKVDLKSNRRERHFNNNNNSNNNNNNIKTLLGMTDKGPSK